MTTKIQERLEYLQQAGRESVSRGLEAIADFIDENPETWNQGSIFTDAAGGDLGDSAESALANGVAHACMDGFVLLTFNRNDSIDLARAMLGGSPGEADEAVVDAAAARVAEINDHHIPTPRHAVAWAGESAAAARWEERRQGE